MGIFTFNAYNQLGALQEDMDISLSENQRHQIKITFCPSEKVNCKRMEGVIFVLHMV